MRRLRQYARLALFDLPWMIIVTAGVFALGVAMTLLLCLFFLSWEDGFGMLGGILGFVGILLAVLARHMLNPHTRFFIALTMGESRRSWLLFDSLLAAAESLLLCAEVWVLCHVELAVYRLVLPNWQNVLDVLPFFFPSAIAIFIAALVVLNLFWTALMGRFGIKGFFLIWVPLWLLMVLAAPAIDAAQSGERSLLGLIGGVMLGIVEASSSIPWQVIIGAVLLTVLVFSAALLRRIPVKL